MEMTPEEKQANDEMNEEFRGRLHFWYTGICDAPRLVPDVSRPKAPPKIMTHWGAAWKTPTSATDKGPK